MKLGEIKWKMDCSSAVTAEEFQDGGTLSQQFRLYAAKGKGDHKFIKIQYIQSVTVTWTLCWVFGRFRL
jgi:hypothetical protein